MGRVFTNGCFDLFHAGHLRFLEWAAQWGALTVGVNSDQSIRRLKGPGRPIIPEADRLMIVSALSCVDRALLFDGDTPYALIRNVHPAVLVVGNQYQLTESHCDLVRSWGGCVYRAPRFDTPSTTSLLERIKNPAAECPREAG